MLRLPVPFTEMTMINFVSQNPVIDDWHGFIAYCIGLIMYRGGVNMCDRFSHLKNIWKPSGLVDLFSITYF